MALARFKDLCIDANDVDKMAEFWAAVLGLAVEPPDAGLVRLAGSGPEQAVWVIGVPEKRSVKQRVHLDVHAGSVTAVESLGAVRLSADGEFPWTVMSDPEGGELCVFVRSEVPAYRLYEVGVDAAEPAPIARWWATVLGGRPVDDEAGFSYVDQIPGAPFESLVFAPVPEPKAVKNRIHWDVTTDAIAPLLEAGATVLREPDNEIDWTVLADPEGNEFCAFTD